MSHLTQQKLAATPSAPASGKVMEFVNSDGQKCVIDANGHVSVLASTVRSNLIRNSGFWFAQRQVPGTLTTYSNVGGRALTADGWWISNENASTQYRRVDTTTATETNLAGRYYGEWTKITSTGKIQIGQAIEARDVQQYRGRNVRFRTKMKAVTTAATWNIGIAYLTSSGTADTIPSTAGNFFSAQGTNTVDPTLTVASNLVYIAPTSGKTGDNCTASTNCYKCSATTAWQRFSGVFTIPATAQNIIAIVFSDSQVAATAGIALAEVVLCDGEDIQDWCPQPVAMELVAVQRHYQKSFAVDTNPATNVGVNTGEARGIAGKAGAAAEFIPIQFPTRMRAAPSVTFYNPAAANAVMRDVTGAVDCAAATATGASEVNVYSTGNGNAATAVGNLIAVHYTADAEL